MPDDLPDELLTGTQSAISALAHIVRGLPPVDIDGNSPSPIAEQLFAQKEEEYQRLLAILKKRRRQQNELAEQKRRLLINRRVVDAGAFQLHGEQAADQYQEAGRRLEQQVKRLERQEFELVQEIEDILAALNLANTRKWPRGTPQKAFRSQGETAVRVEAPGHAAPATAAATGRVRSVFEIDRERADRQLSSTPRLPGTENTDVRRPK